MGSTVSEPLILTDCVETAFVSVESSEDFCELLQLTSKTPLIRSTNSFFIFLSIIFSAKILFVCYIPCYILFLYCYKIIADEMLIEGIVTFLRPEILDRLKNIL